MSEDHERHRKEQDDINRKHGQFLLDIAAARMQQGSEEHPALEVLRRAHQEQAEADK
jgi:D-lyxose ketol-isomerase